jgi:uncharacterized membrane protein (DUF106 family)
MTADDILRVAITVSVTQMACDLLARYLVYQKEPYLESVSALERAQTKFDKLQKEYDSKKATKQQDKMKKRLDTAKDDLGEAISDVARKHSGPGIVTSMIFVVLFRILGAEHGGKVMGVIPFVPQRLLRKVTMRGLDFGDELGLTIFKDSPGVNSVNQACSFMIIYLLCNMGVKFYIHQLVGERPPPGADGGILAVMESPKIVKGLRQMGIDPDEYKQE